MKLAEAQILSLLVQAKAIEVEVISMQARDRITPTFLYTPQAYFDKANQLGTIASDIHAIGRQQYLLHLLYPARYN